MDFDNLTEEEFENLEHEYGELMCCKCFYRYIGVTARYYPLKDLTCPKCNFKGGIIKTGQEYLEPFNIILYPKEQ